MARSVDSASADAAPPAVLRGIKRRVLERVADADDTHFTVQAGDGTWQPFLDGVHIKVLHESEGTLSYLMRLQPGARVPAHRHPRDEECVVLEGSLRVGTHVEVGQGGYHLAHRGALHACLSTVTGATVFLRGAVPQLRDVLA